MQIVKNIKSFFAGGNESAKSYGNYGSVNIQQSYLYAHNRDLDYFKIDNHLENLELQLNSAVAACTNIGLNLFRNASLRLYKPQGEGRVRVTRHPMANLIYRPNSLYPAKLLWAAIYIDYWYEGNAYLKIDREGTLTPKALYHLPNDRVSIVSRKNWIDYYEYRAPNGVTEKIYPEDIIHFRHGICKTNNRFGWAPLRSTLLQVMTDQEAARFLAALLKNNAVPGVMLVPGAGVTTNAETSNILKRLFKAAFTGSGRGGVMVASATMDVKVLGQAPKDLALGDVGDNAEQRICGAFNLPIEITSFNAGSKKSTYNNKGEAHLMAYTSHVLPMCDDFADTLNYRLGAEFGVPDGDYFYAYDYSNIAVLQENLGEKEDRMIKLVAGGIYAVNEARKELKMPATNRPEDDLPIVTGKSDPIEDAVKKQIEAKESKVKMLTEGSVDGEIIEE